MYSCQHNTEIGKLAFISISILFISLLHFKACLMPRTMHNAHDQTIFLTLLYCSDAPKFQQKKRNDFRLRPTNFFNKAEIIDQTGASPIMCFDCVIILFNAYG